MEQLSFFHDHTLLILIVITIMVGQILLSVLFNKFNHRLLLQGQLIETIWTIMPAVVLVFIALPSLHLLYIMDESYNPMITVKTIGHQWYWSYEYMDYSKIEFDSFMIPQSEMNNFNIRLLDVNNRMTVPFNSQIRVITTSADVIHSWAVPSLSVKIDSTPGRLNQANLFINRTGLLYGQCSEICGANHSFMPIVIESISPNSFLKWIKNFS
uniref:Cytochrome c oxidase subunit 2 n=3 Tax=Scolytinae TaxID=55867 RepID=A0A343A4N7_9CUCU|nr:cytochrome c oxidase subunit 2 [Hypothenemus sp. BMNH 1040003]AOY39931.1 cytochrome c oxidase subunit 2 [Scolytinae sp. BMNH 1040002]